MFLLKNIIPMLEMIKSVKIIFKGGTENETVRPTALQNTNVLLKIQRESHFELLNILTVKNMFL